MLGATPIIECLVRKEFCFGGAQGYGDFYPGYIFGFCARPGSVPAFQVMLHGGAQWAEVPIHMIALRECGSIGVEIATWWDCFSEDFEVVEMPLLKGLRCELRGRDGAVRGGNYLFTVDWRGLWADAGDNGHLFAYPNNKIRWHDQSYVRGEMPEESRSWRPNSRRWSAEG